MEISPEPLEARVRDLVLMPEPPLPAWVGDLVGSRSLKVLRDGQGAVRVCAREGPRFCHVTAEFDGARTMDILTFQQQVVEAYRAVFGQMEAQHGFFPVRFWAFVPGIHDDMGAGLDRYMAFNAGRFGAYSAHFGQPSSFGRSIPTASAVGVDGDRFVLHCLAADEPGRPVDNPRQIPAYRYSRRFGPMPPCFARATLLRAGSDQPLLLVGGTASITGEESRHVGNLEAQARETFRNLASVVAAAGCGAVPETTGGESLAPLLAAFRELRIYYTRPADRSAIVQLVGDSFSALQGVELFPACLCRAELVVEIEGLALPSGRLES
jgi:chorismate lyase / 3-hydroxybenzoate synthase